MEKKYWAWICKCQQYLFSRASTNDRFSTGGGDRLVFLWDVASGQIIRRFSGHHHRINDVQLNGESTVIVSASYDATVRLWDCRSQSRFPIQVLDHAKDSVSSVKLTNTEIVTGSIDGCIRIYDIRVGAMISDKIEIPVTCVSLSQDGNCILASTLDSTIRLFDKDNGSCLNEFTGHVNKNYKLTSCLTKSEEKVLGGSEDGKIYTWDLVQVFQMKFMR
jgi:mitogen-activated protein kinase organizer 1